jgi:hypothetical protein
VLSLGVLAPLGYVLAPSLLERRQCDAGSAAEALPYLRIMFVFSWGLLIFFMLGGALRSAGDAQTPLRLGIIATIANLVLNVILIRGPRPDARTRHDRRGDGHRHRHVRRRRYAIYALYRGRWVVGFPEGLEAAPRLADHPRAVPVRTADRCAGHRDERRRRHAARVHRLARAERGGTGCLHGGYTQLFSLITWTSVGLMGAAAAMAGRTSAPASRSARPRRARRRPHRRVGRAVVGVLFLVMPRQLLSIFGMAEPEVVELGVQLMRVLSISGVFIAVALTYTGGLQGTGDTRSPLHISIISQVVIPLGMCFVLDQMGTLDAIDIWLAILIGHMTRCILSVIRFRQGRWRTISVDIGHA